jgi:hypothetical protein
MTTQEVNLVIRNIHEPIEIPEQDLLGRQKLAEKILERLIQSNTGVLGIYGRWGTGKTSLLNLMAELNNKKRSCGQKDLYIEKIDAWKYESSDGLLVPIIIRFKKMVKGADFPKAWQTISRRVMFAGAFTLFDALLNKYTGLDRKVIRENLREAEVVDNSSDHSSKLLEWEHQIDEIEETELAFKEIVDFALQKQDCHRIVMCIDNLDRCSPENAVRLLESIKVFFSVPNCTWVFAMDSEVIASYIDRKYEGTVMDGNSYLDKIVPEQYHLSLSPTFDRQIILDLLNYAARTTADDMPFEMDESKIPQIPSVLVPRRLIKAAKKFSDFYQAPLFGVSPDVIFSLALMYHTWPAFYQRLSSASKSHVKGILRQFFDIEKELVNINEQIPLSENFLKEQELVYFVQTAFRDFKKDTTDNFLEEIVVGLRGLRQIGLP